jgi:hypothetical protein
MKTKTAGTFDEEATNFLNVDLDIFSKSRLEPLPHYCEFPLQVDTLREIVKLGARVVITVYAAEANRIGSHMYARDSRGRSGKGRGSGRNKKPH